jgi:hypothetical protein
MPRPFWPSENAALFPDGSAALFADLNRFRHQAAALPALGLSSLPVVSLLFVRTIERTFGQIWHTARRWPLWKQWAAYCGVLVLLPLGIGAARGRLKAWFRHRPTGGQNPQKGRLKKGRLKPLCGLSDGLFVFAKPPDTAREWRFRTRGFSATANIWQNRRKAV